MTRLNQKLAIEMPNFFIIVFSTLVVLSLFSIYMLVSL